MSVTSTIGTGETYPDVTAWDAGWTTGGWIGQLHNEEIVSALTITIADHSGTAANFTRLECKAGASFKDHANKLTNALRYNASNGAAIRLTADYINTFSTVNAYTTLVGLQIASTGNNTTVLQLTGSNSLLDQCIIEGRGVGGTIGLIWLSGTTSMGRNSLVVSRAGALGVSGDYGVAFANMTIVTPSDVTPIQAGFKLSGASPVVNCAVFGYTSFWVGIGSPSGSNNASDQAISFGTNNKASVAYANQFENSLDATRDFRIKSTGTPDIKNTGTTDLTDIPGAVDIVGTARA